MNFWIGWRPIVEREVTEYTPVCTGLLKVGNLNEPASANIAIVEIFRQAVGSKTHAERIETVGVGGNERTEARDSCTELRSQHTEARKEHTELCN